jgi:DNA-binding transcriptional LysR family regulator
MQLEDVIVFLQIASSGSLSAAAKVSAKPKTTISHQLKRLEDELGAPLFVRSSNRLILNETGRDFLEHARSIRHACERGLDAARKQRDQAIGTIRIGSSGEFSSNLMAPLMLHFAQRHPELRLEVMVFGVDTLLASRDSLDLILYLGDPPMPQAADLTARKIGRFSFGLYASEGYLKRHGHPASPEELRQHHLIGFHNGESLTLWSMHDGAKELSIQPQPSFLTNDYWIAKLATVHDHGIFFMPSFFADVEVKAGLLTPVLPAWQSKDVSMHALFANHRIDNPNLRLLINSLSEHFNDVFSYPYRINTNYLLRKQVET